MASELTVQTIKGPTSGANANTVIVPSGQKLIAPNHVLQFVQADNYSGATTTINASNTTIVTVNLTRLSANSKFCIMVQAACQRPSTSGWHRMGYQIGSSTIVADLKDATTWHTQSQLFDNESLTDAVGSTMQFKTYHSTGVAQNENIKNVSIAVWEIEK